MTVTETETETEPKDRVIPETVIPDCHSRSRLRLRLCLKFMILQPFKEYILSGGPPHNHHHINCKLKLRQLKLKMRFTIKNQS